VKRKVYFNLKLMYTCRQGTTMMTLQEYFSTEPLGARGEMAEYLGISLTWLSLLIHERRTASAALAVKIEKATQGLVTRKDLRPDLFFV
jgi:DNA-binding transcriptional regulator YdaS (Cro superfamily)